MRNTTFPIPARPIRAASIPVASTLGGDEPPPAEAVPRAVMSSEAILKNRRAWDRLTPEDDLILVGWWAGEDFLIVGARMVNIGRGGLMISVASSPPLGRPVWLRMMGSRASESLKAIVLESKFTLFQRRYSARLAFPRLCPDDFFEAAVHGRPDPDPS